MNKKMLLIFLSILMVGCSKVQSKQIQSQSEINSQNNTEIAYTSLKTNSKEANQTISQEEAFNIVNKMLGTLPKGYHLDYDHTEKIDSKDYYVMHFYEIVTDNQQTGDSHTATYEWYYVDTNNKNVYKLDIITGKLIKILD